MVVKICTYVALLAINLSIGFSQQNFISRGRIVDSKTNLALQEVAIYKIFNGDTIETKCDEKGEFQIMLQTGSTLLFKRNGYKLQEVKITDNALQLIKLVPKAIRLLDGDGNNDMEKVDFYLNEKLVPEDEWDDVWSGIKDEDIISIRTVRKDGKGILYIEIK